ncbi:tRNA pseudouridine synthase [Mycoplasma ovis str. Michigan]|uniref:RNA pseudouridylate synthase n=1 Tax=Mycoplasma ovis str. Michigan TaxID=1415773 RepID=A0ABM5P0B8_9MOLU|nr:RluA family pseudouridine synthase [Mycoplasma ovis]AHC39837.1 tRNA pseudouridine synthase [Mycoplasma ovis str. Michigan]
MGSKVVYRTLNYLIVDKVSGILVHKDKFTPEDKTLIAQIKKKYGEDVYLVNRLDKDTSGLLLVARSKIALVTLKSLFEEQRIDKRYLAILSKPLPHPKIKISFSLGRDKGNKLKFSATNSKKYKNALTYAETIHSQLVLLSLKTGRTHQLRAHLFTLSCPILNDPIYGEKNNCVNSFGQYLHSFNLSFTDPWTNKKISITSKPPLEFTEKLIELNIDTSSLTNFESNYSSNIESLSG